jgi:hypothetical protein
MKKFLYPFAALTVATAFFASPAFATPPHGHTVHSNKVVVHKGPTVVHKTTVVNTSKFTNYHVTHGVHFAHGYYYRGHNHNHWRYWRFDARYGCQCYWDPYASCWFYYCVPDDCFYPVSYCPYGTYVWTGNVLPGYPIAPASTVTIPSDVPSIPAPLVPQVR